MATIPELPERISEDNLATIRGTIDLLHAERDQFQHFVNEMLDSLEAMRLEIGRRESELTRHRDTLAEKKNQLDRALTEIQQQEAVNAEQRAQLDSLTAELETCHGQIAKLEEDRDAARARMDEAVTELESVAGVLELVQSTQDELDRTRMELLETQSKLQAEEERDASELVEQLRDQNERLRRELKSSQIQAEKLTSIVEERNQQLAKHRDGMAREIDELRMAVQARASSLRKNESSDDDPAVVVLDSDGTLPDTSEADVNEFLKQPRLEPFDEAVVESVHQGVDDEDQVSLDEEPEAVLEDDQTVDIGDDEEVQDWAARSSDPVIDSVLAKFTELDESIQDTNQ